MARNRTRVPSDPVLFLLELKWGCPYSSSATMRTFSHVQTVMLVMLYTVIMISIENASPKKFL